MQLRLSVQVCCIAEKSRYCLVIDLLRLKCVSRIDASAGHYLVTGAANGRLCLWYDVHNSFFFFFMGFHVPRWLRCVRSSVCHGFVDSCFSLWLGLNVIASSMCLVTMIKSQLCVVIH